MPLPSSSSAYQQQQPSIDRNNLLDYRDYRASSSWSDLLEEEARGKKPWKKVALAVFLFLVGAVLLTTGIVTWYQAPGQGISVALLVLGSICFLPGFYHTRIAYLAWRGVAGYSLNDIPDM